MNQNQPEVIIESRPPNELQRFFEQGAPTGAKVHWHPTAPDGEPQPFVMATDYSNIEHELRALREKVVWEFNEEEVPQFMQGQAGEHELAEAVTAERCTQLVSIIMKLRDENAELREEREKEAAWQKLSDVSTNVVPGDHGEGVEVPVTPESIRASLAYLQKEWDDAECIITNLRAKCARLEGENAELKERFDSVFEYGQEMTDECGRFQKKRAFMHLAYLKQKRKLEVEKAKCARLEDVAKWAIKSLEIYGPEPSHKGSCGPDMGCDAGCMDCAAFSEALAKAKEEL